MITATENNEGIMPVLTVKVDGITCRALIDTHARSSYASAKLLDLLKKKPSETITKCVHMLISSKATKQEVYDTPLYDTVGKLKCIECDIFQEEQIT